MTSLYINWLQKDNNSEIRFKISLNISLPIKIFQALMIVSQ